jgi:hypothetical protein
LLEDYQLIWPWDQLDDAIERYVLDRGPQSVKPRVQKIGVVIRFRKAKMRPLVAWKLA